MVYWNRYDGGRMAVHMDNDSKVTLRSRTLHWSLYQDYGIGRSNQMVENPVYVC